MKFDELDPATQQALEAAAFRRLVSHLRDRPQVQNIDLMRLADFCRNCLGKWLAAAAESQGAPLDKEQARDAIYGMPYATWKAQHQGPEGPPLTPTPLMPTITYDDAPAAIAWLCAAFDFQRKVVYDSPDGRVAHAQLTYGNAMIMVSSSREGPDALLVAPARTGPATAGVYVVVAEVDAHHDKVMAHGATLVRPLTDQHYGGRDYVCRDPFGHLWSFGTFDPWRG